MIKRDHYVETTFHNEYRCHSAPIVITDIEKYNGLEVIILSGRFTAETARDLEKTMKSHWQKNEMSDMIFNFNDVAFLSSAGIRTLMVFRREAEKKEKRIVLSHVAVELIEILEVVGLKEIFPVFDTDKEAILFLERQ